MKKLFTFFLIILFSTSYMDAQVDSRVDSLVRVGIRLHDEGKYKDAIDVYKEALKMDPKSSLVNYEIGYSYFEQKDYKKAIEYCDKVLKTDNPSVLGAYIVKGSSLDYQNKIQESIDVFEEGVQRYKDNYLLYFNLALVYNKIEKYQEAEKNLIEAIRLRYDHSSSHMQLGYTCNSQNKRVQGLMSLYYFLFLEANTPRALNAYNVIQNTYAVSAKKISEKNIDIIIDSQYLNSEFSSVEFMLPMLQAINLIEISDLAISDEEKFKNITTSLFKSLGELDREGKSGLWWDFYLPFFSELSKSEYMDPFCYYISRGANPKALEWLEANEEKVEEFAQWFSLHQTTFGMY